MEWLERLNKSIEYIENHLEEKVDYEIASRIACCSTFHFQRMFSYIAGVSLGEYIRRRRMTIAAFELQNSDIKIIDISLKYGYESPTAFNRAFQTIHGVSPSKARIEGITLKAFPPISFKISIKGDIEMNYRIEKKEAFKIVGVKEHYDMNVEECFIKIPMFWQKTLKAGIIPEICSLMDQEPFGVLGVSACMNGKDFDYYIAVSSSKQATAGLVSYEVPATTWAIFECVGAMPNAIQELQKQIVSEWLPTSGYEYANAPDIEVYSDGDQSSPTYKSQVWLPIIKKN